MSQHLSGLLDFLRESKGYQTLLAQLAANSQRIQIDIVRSARPFLLAALAKDWDGPVVFLTAAVRRAYNVSEQLPIWLVDDARLYRFAEPSALFYERVPWDASVIRNRIDTLAALGGFKAPPASCDHGISESLDASDAAAIPISRSVDRHRNGPASSDGIAHPALDWHGL